MAGEGSTARGAGTRVMLCYWDEGEMAVADRAVEAAGMEVLRVWDPADVGDAADEFEPHVVVCVATGAPREVLGRVAERARVVVAMDDVDAPRPGGTDPMEWGASEVVTRGDATALVRSLAPPRG